MHSHPMARTGSGMVRGTRQGRVAVFRGVPFAAPPVGADRFAPPRAVPPWTGTRDATAFGPPVPSREQLTGGDDWLTLAVWTPDLGAAGLPVVVWISGGAYLQCDTANPHLDGATLAAAGMVVVSANYRTGVEGFAHLEGAPDNRGLLDQIAALRWVQDNVVAFGGDPARVTVLGESAGAGSIAALLVMPSAAGLFRRAALQSVPGTYFSVALAADVTAEIAAQVGRAPHADGFAELSPAALVTATEAVTDRLPAYEERWGPVAYSSTPFSPVVDGEVLPSAPWSALADGGRGEELLVSHVRDEFRLLVPRLFPDPVADDVADAVVDRVAPAGARGYRAAFPDASAADRREMVLADWLFRMPTIHFADAAARGGLPVWTYELTWAYGPHGASHALDTLLVFGTVDIYGEVTGAGPVAVEQERALAALMRAELLAFVADGNPGWDRYEPGARRTRVYSARPDVRRYPEEASYQMWRDHHFGPLDLR